MDDDRMKFGRHKGKALRLVPVEYLARVAETFKDPPGYVLAELKRRADIRETRDGLIAESALSSRLFPRRRRKRRSPHDRWYAAAARHCIAGDCRGKNR